MLTAIVRSNGSAFELGRSLAPLVPGVVEGLLSEVLIVSAPGDSDTLAVARASGAELVEADDWRSGFMAAARLARCPLLLVLDGGIVLGETFWAVAAHRLRDGEAGRVYATQAEAAGMAGKAFRRLTGRVSADQALVMPRDLAAAGDPWSGRYGGRLLQLPASSLRLKPRAR